MNAIMPPVDAPRAVATAIDEIYSKLEEKFEVPLELQLSLQDILTHLLTDKQMLPLVLRVPPITDALRSYISSHIPDVGPLNEKIAELTEVGAQLSAENTMLSRNLEREAANALRYAGLLEAQKKIAESAKASAMQTLRNLRAQDEKDLAQKLEQSEEKHQQRADAAITAWTGKCIALVERQEYLAERAVAEANRKVAESQLWAQNSVARIMRLADIEIACVRKDSEIMEAEMRSRFSKAFATVRAKSAKQREKDRIADLEAIAMRDGRIAGLEAINAKHLTERLQVDNTEVLAMLERFEGLLGDSMSRMAEDNSDAANFRTEIREAVYEMKAAVFSVVGELRGLLDNDVPELKTAVQTMLKQYDVILNLLGELLTNLKTVQPLMELAVRTLDEGIENVRTEYEIMRRTTPQEETRKLNASIRLVSRMISNLDPQKLINGSMEKILQPVVTATNNVTERMGLVAGEMHGIARKVNEQGDQISRLRDAEEAASARRLVKHLNGDRSSDETTANRPH